jgi:hypothetical protein
MRITPQQQGPIAQNELAKFAMIGSDGEIELHPALTDDDGSDFEVRRRRRFGWILTIQVKSSLRLRRNFKQMELSVKVLIPANQLGGHRAFWFFFAHLNSRRLEFANPCFLVPSIVFYRKAPRWRVKNKTMYEFAASMSPTSRDQWCRYRVDTKDIGRRLLEILSDMERGR